MIDISKLILQRLYQFIFPLAQYISAYVVDPTFMQARGSPSQEIVLKDEKKLSIYVKKKGR